jgi:hypothetical protein
MCFGQSRPSLAGKSALPASNVQDTAGVKGIGMKKLLVTAAMLWAFAWAQSSPIEVSIQAFIVGEDGTLTENSSAEGGDLVEYQVTATNVDPTTMPSGTVTINGPVPETSTYVSGSATENNLLDLEFSSNSTSFNTVEASPVRLLRWTVNQPLEPGESVDLSYRVTINGAPSSSDSGTGSADAFTQAMFGHLGVIEFECPSELEDSSADVEVTCGQTFDDFNLFRQKWDLYADYEGEVPVIPQADSAWGLDGELYARDYTLNGFPYFIRYSPTGDQGLVTAIYPK